MRKLIVFAVAVALSLAVAAPAFAATGAGGAGRAFGAYHSGEAVANGGFTGDSNPGINHTGFSGFGM